VNRTDEFWNHGALVRITLEFAFGVSGEFGRRLSYGGGEPGRARVPLAHARIRSAKNGYGSGKAIRIGVGAAAAGAGVLFLVCIIAGRVTGCVQKD